jgi:hypothetical protein
MVLNKTARDAFSGCAFSCVANTIVKAAKGTIENKIITL